MDEWNMDLNAAHEFKNLRVLLEGSDRIWIADKSDEGKWYLINKVDSENEMEDFKVIAWKEL